MDKLNIMTKYLISLIAVLLLAIFIGYRQYDILLKEKNRLSMNNITLMNSNKEYKVILKEDINKIKYKNETPEELSIRNELWRILFSIK